jgi:hypothetical protein
MAIAVDKRDITGACSFTSITVLRATLLLCIVHHVKGIVKDCLES